MWITCYLDSLTLGYLNCGIEAELVPIDGGLSALPTMLIINLAAIKYFLQSCIAYLSSENVPINFSCAYLYYSSESVALISLMRCYFPLYIFPSTCTCTFYAAWKTPGNKQAEEMRDIWSLGQFAFTTWKRKRAQNCNWKRLILTKWVSLHTHYIVSCQVMNYYAHAYYDYSVCNTHTFTHDVTPQVLAWRIKVRLTVSEFLTLARSYPLLHWTIGSPSWRDDIIQSWDPFDFSHQPTQHAEVGRKNRTEGTRVQKSLYYEK